MQERRSEVQGDRCVELIADPSLIFSRNLPAKSDEKWDEKSNENNDENSKENAGGNYPNQFRFPKFRTVQPRRWVTN